MPKLLIKYSEIGMTCSPRREAGSNTGGGGTQDQTHRNRCPVGIADDPQILLGSVKTHMGEYPLDSWPLAGDRAGGLNRFVG